jgi:hypothetical protein
MSGAIHHVTREFAFRNADLVYRFTTLPQPLAQQVCEAPVPPAPLTLTGTRCRPLLPPPPQLRSRPRPLARRAALGRLRLPR